MRISPCNLYSIEKWSSVITENNCDNVIDTFLHTICYNYYNNNIVIDLLLQKYKDKKDVTNKILLYIINNVPCYNLNKYVKLYNKTSDTKLKPSKKLTSLVTSLWAFESFINKKNFNTFENQKLKLLKSKSINKWLEYFNYLIDNRNNISDLYIINTFERFLQITPSYLKVWLLYIDFRKSIDKDKPQNVFILFNRLNSVTTINTIYTSLDPKLKNYLRVYYLNEIEMWQNNITKNEALCKDVDLISSYFKVIRNLKANNDSLDEREIEQLLLIYLNVLNKHLALKYRAEPVEILGTIIGEFGFKSACDPKVKNYLQSKNLNNFFYKWHGSASTSDLMSTFSKFVLKKLLSTASKKQIKRDAFSLYLKDFVYNQKPKLHSNQIIIYENIKRVIKKYGTIEDYKRFVVYISKLQSKNKRPEKRPRPNSNNVYRKHNIRRKLMP